MGEAKQAEGSQNKPGQKAEELPPIQPRNTLGSCWRVGATGQKAAETATPPSAACRLQHRRPTGNTKQGNTTQTQPAEIAV